MLKNIVYIYDQAYLSGGAAKIAFGEALEMQKKGYNVIFFAAVGPVGEELLSSNIEKADALGASIDVYKFSSDAGKKFFGKCAEYIESKKELKMWSEVALNDILKDVEFRACPLVGRWLEIDNHDDLAAAEKLFAEEQ